VNHWVHCKSISHHPHQVSLCPLLGWRLIYRKNNFPSRARPATSPTRTRTQSSAGSSTRPANAGTRNPRG